MRPGEGAPGGPNAKTWLQAYRTKEWGCRSIQPVALPHTATIGQMVRALSHRNLEGTGEVSSPGTVSVGQALAHLFSFLTLKYDSYQRRHSCFLNSRPAVPPSAVTCIHQPPSPAWLASIDQFIPDRAMPAIVSPLRYSVVSSWRANLGKGLQTPLLSNRLSKNVLGFE